jgi:hypothetical protein
VVILGAGRPAHHLPAGDRSSLVTNLGRVAGPKTGGNPAFLLENRLTKTYVRTFAIEQKRLFAFQWGLMVASRSQLGLPA